jgi:hypothetical protein
MASQQEPDDLAGLRVPDDASALDADRWRYYEELSGRGDIRHTPDGPAAADHPGRWRDGQPWFGFFGSHLAPTLFMLAAVLAMAGTLMLAMVPRTDAPALTEPLATTEAEVGSVGGLLPPEAVTLNGSPRLLRDVRPALIAWLPGGDCPECRSGLAAAMAQAESAGVRFLVVGPTERAAAVQEAALTAGAPAVLTRTGAFAEYRPEGLTLFVVAGDGTVTDVVRNSDAGTQVSTSLGQAATSAP